MNASAYCAGSWRRQHPRHSRASETSILPLSDISIAISCTLANILAISAPASAKILTTLIQSGRSLCLSLMSLSQAGGPIGMPGMPLTYFFLERWIPLMLLFSSQVLTSAPFSSKNLTTALLPYSAAKMRPWGQLVTAKCLRISLRNSMQPCTQAYSNARLKCSGINPTRTPFRTNIAETSSFNIWINFRPHGQQHFHQGYISPTSSDIQRCQDI